MNSKTYEEAAADRGLSPASPASQSIESRLLDAMDRAALHFISILENEDKDADGHPLYDIQLKMKLFEKGENWLVKRRKLRPDTGGQEGEGVTELRAMINDPGTWNTLKEMLFEKGVVFVPEPKNGRPTSQEALVRERYHEHQRAKKGEKPGADDSGWQKLLKEETH